MEHWKEGLLGLVIALAVLALALWAYQAHASPEDAEERVKACRTFGPTDRSSPMPLVTVCGYGVQDLRDVEVMLHPRRPVRPPA